MVVWMQNWRVRTQGVGRGNTKAVTIFSGIVLSMLGTFAWAGSSSSTGDNAGKSAGRSSQESQPGASKYGDKTRLAGKTPVAKKNQPSLHEAAYRARALKVANSPLGLKSNVALVIDQATGEMVISKNIDEVHPVASITKLMTALVILDAQAALDQRVEISNEDIDIERGSRSRLKVGTELSRNDLLHLALMASENRAAHALGRTFPGGMAVFVEAMNAKASELGMMSSRFVEPTGLSSANVSTASDLVKLVRETHRHALIRRYSTAESHQVNVGGRDVAFRNTNRLVTSETWDIGLSKTGFINEAGRCLVMQAKIQGRPMVIVLLDSWGKLSRIGDANRIRKWLTSNVPHRSVQS